MSEQFVKFEDILGEDDNVVKKFCIDMIDKFEGAKLEIDPETLKKMIPEIKRGDEIDVEVVDNRLNPSNIRRCPSEKLLLVAKKSTINGKTKYDVKIIFPLSMSNYDREREVGDEIRIMNESASLFNEKLK